MITQDQLKEVQTRVEQLNHYLNIPAKKIQYEEEQLRTQAPEFWEDQKRAEEQMKVVKGLEKWIKDYQEVSTLADELTTAFDFYKEELVTEQEVDELYARTITSIEELELKNMLRKEEDSMDAVLKINSGAGGTEAQDWAQMLMRMYMQWADKNGYRIRIANLLEGDDAGIKSCTLEIEGEFAYGYLKSENGVHRLVRVSPYNAQGKRMTSFASVFVTPLVDDTIEVNIEQARISWDTFRSSGAGGQNVNKVESGVRLRYQYTDPYTGVQEEIMIENQKLKLDIEKAHPEIPEPVKYNGIPASLIAPTFSSVHFDIQEQKHSEYVFPGGRGSTKSSFVGLEIIDLLMKNEQMHACVLRQVADTLRALDNLAIGHRILGIGFGSER